MTSEYWLENDKLPFWLSSFSVSIDGFLLCFLLCFSPTLPRIPDYWVRYKLWIMMTYRESIWLPSFPGISSVLKHCWNARRGKYESIDFWTNEFHCWIQQWNVWNFLSMCHFLWSMFPHTERTHEFVCFSYSTIYTMFPVFSLVLDKDVKSEVAMLYPELYKDLLKVFNEWSHTAVKYNKEMQMKNVEYDVLFYCFLSTGSTTIF